MQSGEKEKKMYTIKQLQKKIDSANEVDWDESILPPCSIKGCKNCAEYTIGLDQDTDLYYLCHNHFCMLEIDI